MPKSRIMIQLDDETIARIDQARGAIPRAAWFRIAADNLLDQASVSQQEENRKPGNERSNRSRRAGKGSGQRRALAGGKQADKPLQPIASGSHSPTPGPQSPSRKPKACKHTNQIRKLGVPYCTDCGEFV